MQKPQHPKTSIIVRISLALAIIVLLGTGTMLISYWLSERAENDSLAINVAGSLRMQSYKLGLLALAQPTQQQDWQAAQEKIAATWTHPVFTPFLHSKPHIAQVFAEAQHNWQVNLLPQLRQIQQGSPHPQLQQALHQHAQLLDTLVSAIQADAEHKVRSFRLVQIVALFATLLVSALVMYSLKVKVEQPLSQLTAMARRIANGDYSYRIPVGSQDELGVLASAFNTMSRSIESSYETLEQQVNHKTRELQQSNSALQLLYDIARQIIEHNPQGVDFDGMINRLAQVVGSHSLELCLMTEAGDSPYLQIKPASDINAEMCNKQNCAKCLSSRGLVEITNDQAIYRFQLNRHERHYGLIVCRLPASERLSPWQEQLIQSATDQLAIGLSLKADEDQSHRLAVLQERNAIARELHDSLAQALSYLKIQVTRLNKAIDREDKTTMEDVAEELREGLNNAYRQLRELLTTFRLKIDGGGLRAALEANMAQLRPQTSMQLELAVALDHIPLTPNEEIHLLQIIREASQNAIHHSQGQTLWVSLQEAGDQSIQLSIRDDGKGLPQAPEKLNHYGLAIMRERARHLGGELQIHNCQPSGVEIQFSFVPQVMKARQARGLIGSDQPPGIFS